MDRELNILINLELDVCPAYQAHFDLQLETSRKIRGKLLQIQRAQNAKQEISKVQREAFIKAWRIALDYFFDLNQLSLLPDVQVDVSTKDEIFDGMDFAICEPLKIMQDFLLGNEEYILAYLVQAYRLATGLAELPDSKSARLISIVADYAQNLDVWCKESWSRLAKPLQGNSCVGGVGIPTRRSAAGHPKDMFY